MENRLSNDADFLLCVLYDAYRQRRKNGESAFDARIFGDPEDIQESYFPTWPTDDIVDAAFELSRAGFVVYAPGDDAFDTLVLERSGISMMEHRFGDKIDKLLSRISELRGIFLG